MLWIRVESEGTRTVNKKSKKYFFLLSIKDTFKFCQDCGSYYHSPYTQCTVNYDLAAMLLKKMLIIFLTTPLLVYFEYARQETLFV
jgi:hypothetical protein